MTRNAKIAKLANAIRDYRGAYNPTTMVWRVRPIPTAKGRVEKWLGELGLDVATTMPIIDGFETKGQFREWLAKLPAAKP